MIDWEVGRGPIKGIILADSGHSNFQISTWQDLGKNKGKAPADAKVRDRPSLVGGVAKKSPILTRNQAAKGEEVSLARGNPPSVTEYMNIMKIFAKNASIHVQPRP